MSAGADSAVGDNGVDRLLRACIECGLCLPHCATYLASGNEALSPRGRLMLLNHVVHERLPAADRSVMRSFDQCLGCMVCAALCPSGVSADLLESLARFGRKEAHRRTVFGQATSVMRGGSMHARRLLAGRVRRGLARLLGPAWRRRLAGAPRPFSGIGWMLGTLPAVPDSDRELTMLLADLIRVGANGLDPARSMPPLRRAAGSVAGGSARLLAPGTADRLNRMLSAHGCTTTATADDAGHDADAEALSARSKAQELDRLVAYLDRLDGRMPPRLGAVPLRVAVHDPCQARPGSGLREVSRRLLHRIGGLQLVEPAEAGVCCGGLGDYVLRHPDLSRRMGMRKARALAATGCRLVVTVDLECLGQIAAGLALVSSSVPVLPLTDLVWYAWSAAATDPGSE